MTDLRKAAEMQANPHGELLSEIMNPNTYKTEREHAAVREIQALRQALVEPEQEPYCWVQSKLTQGMFYKEKPRKIRTIPLYTSPPKCEWVDLTDEEIAKSVGSPIDEVYLADFRKVIEKLKEKNNHGK